MRNDPHQTAVDFRRALEEQSSALSDVVFAIADWSAERKTLGPYRAIFAASRGASHRGCQRTRAGAPDTSAPEGYAAAVQGGHCRGQWLSARRASMRFVPADESR